MFIDTSAAPAAAIRKPEPPKSNAPGPFADVLEQFLKVAYQTPAEKARAAVLEKHDLDEAAYEKLPPKERAAIDQEIADAVRKVTERATGVPQDQGAFTTMLQQLGKL